jgi:hypothetical protein
MVVGVGIPIVLAATATRLACAARPLRQWVLEDFDMSVLALRV